MQTRRNGRTRQSSRRHVLAGPPAASHLPSWLIGGEVPRLRWDDPAVAGHLRSCRPVVLTGGCPLTKSVVGQWDFDYLARAFGDFEHGVHFVPTETGAFARHYGKGLGKGGVQPMSFQQFVSTARRERVLCEPGADAVRPSPSAAAGRFKYYLQSPLVWRDEVKAEGGETEVSGPWRKAPFGAALERDVASLGWEWLEGACAAAGAAPIKTCQLWAGHGGGSTPCHFDSLCNFLAQLSGRKHVLLFPPSQSFRLYPYPVGHAMDNFALFDPEEPDAARFPAALDARGLATTLLPGDVLWLPRFYWHHVRQLDPGRQNLSLNFWCGQKGTAAYMRELRAKAAAASLAATRGPTSTQGSERAVVGGARGRDPAAAGAAPPQQAGVKGGAEGGAEVGPADEREAVGWLHAARLAEAAVRGAFAWRLRVGCAAVTRRLRGGCAAVARRLRGGCAAGGGGSARCAVGVARGTLDECARNLTRPPAQRPIRRVPRKRRGAGVIGERFGEYLNALAEGADAYFPPGSAAASTAAKIRQELGAALGGAAQVDALLRSMTRDGRLHPGLAPKVRRRGELRGETRSVPHASRHA